MKNWLDCIVIILAFIVCIALSWVITAFLFWLVCLCFGITFTLLKATGCWIILCVCSGALARTITIQKK
jgi:hypothetical protein